MNLFYKMELLRCYRFFGLTFQLLDIILESLKYNMIEMYSLLQKQFTSTSQNCFASFGFYSIVDLSASCYCDDNKEKIVTHKKLSNLREHISLVMA